jgi:CheY-like chemotaxis protein
MSNIILCADDSKIMQTVAEITFRVSDYQYVGALSADEALDKARAQKPALILADVAMPDTDGYELCRAIKSDPALADVPVIMMCGNSSAYDAARGSEVRADGHLSKPWDTQVLLDKVAEILQSAGGAKAAAARGAAKPAAQQARPAVVPQPPILPATAPVQATAAAGRSATMIGMPQIPLEVEKPRARPDAGAGAAGRAISMPEVDNAQPLAAPLPPRTTAAPAAVSQPAAQPAARAPTAPAVRPPGAAVARVATAPPVAAGKATARPTTVGTPTTPAAAATPAAAPTPSPRAATPAPAPVAAATPAATPMAARAPAAAATPAAASQPRPAAAATPAAARPAAATPAAAAPVRAAAFDDSGAATMKRAPMIKGTATRQPTSTGRTVAEAAVAAQVHAALPRAAAAVAREAGLDPGGPEMRALLALSKDVVERIVWEVVPELAEAIIRENLEQLAAKR